MTKPEQPNTEAQTEQDLEQPVETQADQEAAAGQESSSQGDALARIGELEAALAAAQDEVQSRKDAALRAAAEAENVRRRAAQDVQKARDFALEKFAAELLPVVDNLERALQSVGDSSDSQEALVAGIEMTHKSFLSTLEKFGIASVDPQGQPFNPEQHEAMGMQESAEQPANTVLAVLQKGYVLNGRLLRPAMVMVSREPSAGVDTTA